MLRQPSKQKYVFYSLVLHSILLSILIISFDFDTPPAVMENTNQNIVNAMVVNSSPLVVQKKISIPHPVVKTPPVKQPIKPQETKAPLPIHPITQAIAIPDKKAKKQKEDAIQKQLLTDLKKQTDTKKKLQQQKNIESDFAKEMKALKEKSIEQQMALEKKRLEGIQSAQMQGIVDKYKALILQSISQHWLVPHNADKRLYAQLLIHVAPGGMVLDVQIIKGSGDDALDRSARSAVFKASPLPVPTDPNVFESFRQFVLKVKPENILESG